MLKLLCQTFTRLNAFLTCYFVDFFCIFLCKIIRTITIMSTDDSGSNTGSSSDERDVFHAFDFALAPHSWAHMFRAGFSSWAHGSPVEELTALQWFYPFNFGLEGVAIPGEDTFKTVQFVRQDSQGFFNPVVVQVHTLTGAARIESVHEHLLNLEPGFMVPLPSFICKSLDWLFAGWDTKRKKAIADEESSFVDSDGLFTEDEEWEVLRRLTMSRSDYARSGRLVGCVNSMEVGREDLQMVDVEEKGTADAAGDGETRSEPVRIRRASVDSDSRNVHCASFARFEVSVDMSTDIGDIVDLTQSVSQTTDSDDSEEFL